MTFTLDPSGLLARMARAEAAVAQTLPGHADTAARLLVLESGYAAVGFQEADAIDLDAVVLAPEVDGTTVTVGIVQLADWITTEPHEHCQKCLDYAAGGPYTADFPDRPETVDTHDAGNPCHCLWALRELPIEEFGPQELAAAKVDLWQDIRQAWSA